MRRSSIERSPACLRALMLVTLSNALLNLDVSLPLIPAMNVPGIAKLHVI